MVVLAMLTDSRLLLISLLSISSCFDCRCRAQWYPKSTSLLASTGMAKLLSTDALIFFHSSADSRTFALVIKETAVSPSSR
jgi:hypothetical protein